MGDGSGITERAAASPGAAQNSGRMHLVMMSVGVEEEEALRRTQKPYSTITTSNTDTAKSKNYDCSQLLPHIANENKSDSLSSTVFHFYQALSGKRYFTCI